LLVIHEQAKCHVWGCYIREMGRSTLLRSGFLWSKISPKMWMCVWFGYNRDSAVIF